MKERVIEKIKSIGLNGFNHFGKTNFFSDDKYATRDMLYKYRISKIIVYLNENNILGIQAFYKNEKNEEIAGEKGIGIDKSMGEVITKTLNILSNDYLCNLNIFFGEEEYISKLIFKTKKGKELVVGNDKGKERILGGSFNKDNIILSISGGFDKNLELISCKYLSFDQYLGNTHGYFELRKKLKKDNIFKQNIINNFNELSESDKFLFRVCCLPENSFFDIIKFCLFV